MTLLIWAAVLGCAVAWGLPLFTRATPVPAGASLAAPAPPAGLSLERLLGQPPVAPLAEAPVVAAASRFQLVGVVAGRQAGGKGLALIAVDGKPAKPVRVGREVEPGLRLLTVAHRQVELGAGPGAPSVTLTLAPLPEAQRGRPDAMPGAMPGAVPGMVPPMPGVPGAMRVPPMTPPLPAVQMPQGMPGVGSPQGLMRQGMGNAAAGNLPYQPDGENETSAQGGAVAPMR